MKKIKIIAIIIAILCLTQIIGCGKLKEIEKYKNDGTYQEDNITTTIKDILCYKSGETYYIRITLEAISTNTNKTKYTIKNYKIFNEETNAEYTAKPNIIGIEPHTFTLEYKISKEYSVESRIPTEIKKEKYKFEMEINNSKIILHLYEKGNNS